MHVDDFSLEPSLRALLSELIAVFSVQGVEAYATGGFLRDALLGKKVRDLDISVSADPLQLGPRLADTFSGHYFPLDAERRLVRVLLPAHDIHLDLLPLTGVIEDDLLSRDYTVDAMAALLGEVAAGSILLIDPTGGFDDLRDGTIRLVSEDALRRDPLRLLRGVRLASQLGFRIEPRTRGAIQRYASLLEGVVAERQRDELAQILSTPRATAGLRLMDELDLLDRVMPEIASTRGVEQPKEHHWDVFGHSLAAVEALDMWSDGRAYFSREYVPNTQRCSLIKLAGFLHDIGKPQTKSFDDTGRMRFLGHADAGAEIAVRLMQRLRFSSRETELVRAMVDAHLRPLLLFQQGLPTRRAVYRFFRDTGEAGIDTLYLSLADHVATVGPRVDLEGWRRHVAVVDYLLRTRLHEPEVVHPPKLVDGDDLMSDLGLSPGPLIGELLEIVREAQAAGEVATRAEALELARRHLDETEAPPPSH